LRYYLDASLIVAAITREAATPAVQLWLDDHKSNTWLISEWGVAEVASALSIKVRTGQMQAQSRPLAVSLFNRVFRPSVEVVSVNSHHFSDAARFVERHELSLRASDALHLAICGHHGATLCTLDNRLATAGPILGVPTLRLSSQV
jgi:predicted nucleic acid-binding protein